MSRKDEVYNQDLSQEGRPQMLIAELLFFEKPEAAPADKLKAAFQKYVGEVDDIPHENNKAADSDSFAVKKYKAVFKDAPQGIPPMACFTTPSEVSFDKVDAFQRSQFWDVENGSEFVDKCKYAVHVFSFLSASLHYKQQAELILAQLDAALDVYPDCVGVYVPASGKLNTAEKILADRKWDLAGRFINAFINARFFNINGTNGDMVIDTIGMYVFGAADAQMHFHGLDPNDVVRYVYNITSYQFNNEYPVKSGDTIDGIGADGNIAQDIQWRAQYENSLIQPVRTVLDINCAQYAAGTRN